MCTIYNVPYILPSLFVRLVRITSIKPSAAGLSYPQPCFLYTPTVIMIIQNQCFLDFHFLALPRLFLGLRVAFYGRMEKLYEDRSCLIPVM